MFRANGTDFDDEIQALATELEQDTEREMKRLTSDVYTESQRRVPVDTGDLKASGDHETTGSGTDTEGDVWYAEPYAAYVGLGTRYMNAQPYLWKVAEEEIKNALDRLAE